MAKLQKIEKLDIILIIIILILIVVNLVLYTKKIEQPKYMMYQTSENTSPTFDKKDKEETQIVEVPQTEQEIIQKLSTLGERDRMEYYCGIYFKHIEKKEYEEAYNLLYPEFKEKYFPTLEEYETYINNTYPANWGLEYEDITRQGYIYVLKLKVLDLFGSKENEKSQRIVIKENNYNDFIISFQVI